MFPPILKEKCMRTVKAKAVNYQLLRSNVGQNSMIYPFIKDSKGRENIYSVSPTHGRSFVLKKLTDFQWIIGKGNGLCYTDSTYLLTSSICGESWGALSLKNAIRDFEIGNEVRDLGIKTNEMECVLQLESTIVQNGEPTEAALLQYKVECPYRICDFAFMPIEEVRKYVERWLPIKSINRKEKHIVAADILISNLRFLRDNGIMHNSMNIQNYTWALELLDFEASRSNKMPYENIEYEKHVPMLSEMEILQTYEIINYIGWCLHEEVDYRKVDAIFKEYDIDLSKYRL